MYRQLNQPGVRLFILPSSSFSSPLIISRREKSKFRGKKQKSFDVVKWQHNNIPLQPHEDFEPDEWLPRRLTYYPEGLWSSLVPRPKPLWWFDKFNPLDIETLSPTEKEWNDVAIYPEIIPSPKITHTFHTSYLGRTKWYKELAEMASVDEKNVALTKITRHCLRLDHPFFNHFDGLEIAQNITRTHLIEGLPQSYYSDNIDEGLVDRLTPLLLDSIRVNKYEAERGRSAFVPLGSRCQQNLWNDRITEINLFQEINNLVSNAIAPNTPHILDLQVNTEDRIRSWWYASQLPLPKFKPMLWKIHKYQKIDQVCKYDAATPLSIRTSSPLPRVVSGSDDLSLNASVPELKYHPSRFGVRVSHNYLPTLPGFWHPKNFDPSKSEADDFPYLTMFGLHDLNYRKFVNFDQDFHDDEDVVKCKAILGSFSWLNSLAFYHGFTPFHEVTYPFVNQGLVTDGQRYYFFVYQMNAHTFHSDLFKGDGPKNICWISPEIKLYESYQDGQFTGINTEVVRQLIKMYSLVPSKELNVNYRPFIKRDDRPLEQIDEDRKTIGWRANNKHSSYMHGYKYARLSQLYHKLYVDNPKYDTTMMRIALRPRLKPAEDYYYQWKY